MAKLLALSMCFAGAIFPKARTRGTHTHTSNLNLHGETEVEDLLTNPNQHETCSNSADIPGQVSFLAALLVFALVLSPSLGRRRRWACIKCQKG